MSAVQVTGLAIVVSLVGFNAAFLALARTFDYPDILRRPAAEVLRRFRAGGRRLLATWYAFMLSGLIFTSVPLLLHPILEDRGVEPLMLVTGIGLLAGLIQVLGLLRWPFLVPFLAERHAAAAGDDERRAVEIVFEAAHRYLGIGVGEHLGYILTAAWAGLMAVLLPQAGLIPEPLGRIGLLPAVAILAGTLEPAGVSWAGPVNAIGYLGFSVWLFVIGLLFLLG